MFTTAAIVYTLGSVTIPSLASVYNEFALKKHMETSVHEQNFFLYFYGALFKPAGRVWGHGLQQPVLECHLLWPLQGVLPLPFLLSVHCMGVVADVVLELRAQLLILTQRMCTIQGPICALSGHSRDEPTA